MAKKSSKKRSSKKTSAKKFNYIFLLFIIIIIVGLLIHESNPSYISQKSDYLKKEYSSLKKNISVSKEIDKSVVKELSDIAKSAKKETVKTKDVIVEKASEEKKTESSFPKVPEKFNIRSVKDLDIPTLTYQRPSQLIKYKGFTVSFNKDSKVPNWVGYELTSEETKGTIKRTNKFVKDIKAIGCPTNSDYTRSGYDRGHIAPAADMAWDSDAMRESFYFTNMCPQEPTLNRGAWKKLEDKCRYWAKRDSAIIIISGPVINEKHKTIGKNNVAVPQSFYKVILSPFGKEPKAIAFLLKNEGSLKRIQEFAVPIDSIEKISGINFFYQLPEDLQHKLESTVKLQDWF